jgi:hypothetical protein
MCDPATALVVASTAVTAYGQYEQGEYQSKVARNNAIIQDRLAKDAVKRGEVSEQRHRLKVAQMKGKQRAKLAASGVDLSSGSASQILTDTAEFGELDALTIRSNAEREAFGYQVKGSNYLAESELARSEGRYGAASTILSGGSQVSSRWNPGGGRNAKG